LGKEPSFQKKIKASVKKAVKHISDFEETTTDIEKKNMITSYVDTFTNPKSQKKETRMVLPCI
jgi:hypothetical protein